MSAQPKPQPTPEQLERRAAAQLATKQQRDQLSQRLRSEGEHDLAAKIDNCGTAIPLICCNCGTSKTVEAQCRRRWCPACAYSVQMERVAKWSAATRMLKWPLFLTLTVPNDPDPERIRTLRADWSRMRRRKIIASRISGGITTIEVTEGNGGWHPHMHVLADCKWLAVHVPAPSPRDSPDVVKQKCDHAKIELENIWSNVIGEPASIVAALRARSGDALAYSLKYAVKGSDLIASKLPIGPLIRVISKSRMISAFGDFHGRITPDDEEEKPRCTCPDCGESASFIPAEIAARACISARDKNNALRK